MLSRCGCLGYNLTEGNDYERIYHTMSVIDDVIGDYDADTKRQVVEAICTTTLVDGDHLQVSCVCVARTRPSAFDAGRRGRPNGLERTPRAPGTDTRAVFMYESYSTVVP